eukprot:Skav209381  [mRNA]  locus=scaffold5200:30175:32651:+ [translate_table: standard]
MASRESTEQPLRESEEEDELRPAACTHPLVCLPLVSLLATASAFCLGAASQLVAGLLGVIATGIASALVGTWLFGCRCFLNTSKRSSYWVDAPPLP